jgi:hypothetical protein
LLLDCSGTSRPAFADANPLEGLNASTCVVVPMEAATAAPMTATIVAVPNFMLLIPDSFQENKVYSLCL